MTGTFYETRESGFMNKIEELKWDSNGLVPAVVQDASSGEVLTVAYMNRESMAKTREIGETVFYSRSRRELWHKGETSGHFQKVVSLMADCDRDAIVVRVKAIGPACHTGARSCFFEAVEGFSEDNGQSIGVILAELEKLVAGRKADRPESSYTVKLFDGGLKRILQKVGEEATETVIAGLSGDRQETVREASDLLFHLLVAFRELGISLEDIAAELQSRRK
jgi:phosphoribosyl-ATP pyrophosphohydrolase/phosphoribosyl-AMP cyclohydrolase